MVITCWSVKGGSGTTVVAAALALRLSRVAPPAVIADLAGDIPAVLGQPERVGPGLADWLAAGADVADDALERLAAEVRPGLTLLGAGGQGGDRAAMAATGADGERLLAALGRLDARNVVVDAGSVCTDVGLALAASSERSLLVVRPCYLALRRAVAAPIRPSAVVLVEERNRTLGVADVEDILGRPVVTVPWDAQIARAVDAGLLGNRVPKPLDRALRAAA